MGQEKERDQLKNAQLIIDTQAAEIRMLHALLGAVPVDEGPRIARLEQALRSKLQLRKLTRKNHAIGLRQSIASGVWLIGGQTTDLAGLQRNSKRS